MSSRGLIRTLNLQIVALGLPNHQGGGLAVEGVGGVGVAEQLGQEDLEDVDHIKHGRPCLVDDIQADGTGPALSVSVRLRPGDRVCHSQLVNVGMEDAVHETNAR
jgi:hypothetical protein